MCGPTFTSPNTLANPKTQALIITHASATRRDEVPSAINTIGIAIITTEMKSATSMTLPNLNHGIPDTLSRKPSRPPQPLREIPSLESLPTDLQSFPL